MEYRNKVLGKIKEIDYYSLFLTFLVSGFFGWIFEIVTIYALRGVISSRGLLFVYQKVSDYFPILGDVPIINELCVFWGLPIIVIYGIGGCFISVMLKKVTNYVRIFIAGVFLLTLFEFAASYFCEYVLHVILWDYSNEALNFQGRICFRASMAWGIISIICVRFLVPAGFMLYEKQRKIHHYKRITIFLAVYTGFCIVYRYFVLK